MERSLTAAAARCDVCTPLTHPYNGVNGDAASIILNYTVEASWYLVDKREVSLVGGSQAEHEIPDGRVALDQLL